MRQTDFAGVLYLYTASISGAIETAQCGRITKSASPERWLPLSASCHWDDVGRDRVVEPHLSVISAFIDTFHELANDIDISD